MNFSSFHEFCFMDSIDSNGFHRVAI
uniref:Uncharacterized protein n=1 Tax=Lepeophtheirus salmonis TaxID=72036 RepID=A0A0K2TH61_LEPSM